MEPQPNDMDFGEAALVSEVDTPPRLVVICEHASNRVPDALNNLGVESHVLESHVAWDPGALGVAKSVARRLSAVLVSGNVSRLVYDCNRPPESETAIPVRSEIYDIHGNRNLAPVEREMRIEKVYQPFSRAVTDVIRKHADTIKHIVTIHSFTPIFKGVSRAVEVGVLNGRDDRFAKAMMQSLPSDMPYVTKLNEPYSAEDGVTHTLDRHGTSNGFLNVMIEIRNDLIQTKEQQEEMAACLAGWIGETCGRLSVEAPRQ